MSNKIINGDPKRIDTNQFNLLIDVINQIAQSGVRGYPHTDIWKIMTNKMNNQIIITHGVHYQEYDINGHHHFDIQLMSLSGSRSGIFHIYVEPYPIEEIITYLPDQSVKLNTLPTHWKWSYVSIGEQVM